MDLAFHPIASVFPLLDEAQLADLAADIIAHGRVNEPILLFEGAILDGRNRYRACQRPEIAALKIKPRTRDWTGTASEAIDYVWSSNFHRRHLTASQKAACVVARDVLVDRLAAEARARQEAGRKAGGRGKKKTLARSRAQVSEGKTATKLATLAGVGKTLVEQAQQIQRKDPAAFQAVIEGAQTIPQVMRTIRRAAMRPVAIPDGVYRVVYADPPWHYGNAGIVGEELGQSDAYGRAERFYPSMTIEELCALDIKGRTADAAVLFLWVTSPLLAECFAVIKAWGFAYKASFVWHKLAHNFGHYNSVRHEFLLLCTKGSCLPDHPTPMPESVIAVPRAAHSEKPQEFRRLIERLYDGNAETRLELFGRAPAPGWTVHGNEIAEAV